MLVNIARSHILSDTLRSMMMMQCKRWLILCTVASGHLGSGRFIQCLRAEGRGSNMHDTAQLRWLNNSSYTVRTDWYVPHVWRTVPAVFAPGLSSRGGRMGPIILSYGGNKQNCESCEWSSILKWYENLYKTCYCRHMVLFHFGLL